MVNTHNFAVRFPFDWDEPESNYRVLVPYSEDNWSIGVINLILEMTFREPLFYKIRYFLTGKKIQWQFIPKDYVPNTMHVVSD